MPRGKRSQVDEAARVADELIAAEAKRLGVDGEDNQDEPAPDPEVVDDSIDLDNHQNDNVELEDVDDGFNLDSLQSDVKPQDDIVKNLQQQLSVLKGKYEKETERLSLQLSQAMTEIAELKSNRNEPVAGDATLPDDSSDINELKEQFPTLYKAFIALARAEAKNEVSRATKNTSDKVDAIVQRTAEDQKQRYLSRLDVLVPVWRKLNTHPVFLEWLTKRDEFSGTARGALLTNAYNRLDAETSASFFNAFIKEKGIRVKGRDPNTSENVAPDTSGGGVKNVQQSRTISRREIAQFYRDKSQRKLNMTEQEIAKMEARIVNAIKEGHVRD